MKTGLIFRSVSKRFCVAERPRSFWRDLVSRRRSTRTVIDSLSLDLAPGEVLAVSGRNGAGKTTLLKLAAGLLAPTDGEVLVDGTPVTRAPRDRFGLMLSTSLLYPALTGYQNLAHSAALLGLADSRRVIERVAAQWDLLDRLDAPLETYSLGERALTALARACLARPRVLVLDEPASHLDARHRELLGAYLRAYDGIVLYSETDPLAGLPRTREVAL